MSEMKSSQQKNKNIISINELNLASGEDWVIKARVRFAKMLYLFLDLQERQENSICEWLYAQDRVSRQRRNID